MTRIHPMIKKITFTPHTPRVARAYWRRLAEGATRGYTAEQLDKIADLCVEAEARGELGSIWHMSSIVIGKLDRCQCSPCCIARGEKLAPLGGCA